MRFSAPVKKHWLLSFSGLGRPGPGARGPGPGARGPGGEGGVGDPRAYICTIKVDKDSRNPATDSDI